MRNDEPRTTNDEPPFNRRSPRILLACVVLTLAIAAFVALRPRPAAVVPGLPLPEAIATAAAELPVVTWAAQTQARFEPCGCVAGMNGGLMRRASLLARLPATRTLSLESGGWSGGGRAHEILRTRFYLRGLAAAGIDAVAMGAAELALPRAALEAVLAEAAGLRLPVICANLRDRPGIMPSVEVDAAGTTFLVTAVAPAGSGAGDPVEALTEQAGLARGRPLVCLADLDPDACRALARAVPQVALIIGGRADHPSPEPVAVGSTRVLWAGNHGKVIGSWAWGAPAAAFELLRDTLPVDGRQRELLTGYQQALAEAGFDGGSASGLSALSGGGYAGSAACATCHATAQAAHGRSRHSHAIASLERRGYQHDPDCLRCHVTGLGEGGYARGRAAFADVGCESCHGPANAHVQAMQGQVAATASLPRIGPPACVACHDAENSPAFDFAAYWPRIVHGK